MMRATVVIAALAAAARVAAASPDAGSADDPWAQGVAKDAQDAANKLYDEGNVLFAREAHAPAVAKYRAALALWDHPRIHFNLAVTLIRLDRILEAADELDAALRFADKPFSSIERYREALDYRALVDRQLATVEASCAAPGPRVLLDGKPWFACPGSAHVRVLAGQHLLVAQREGYQTESRPLVLVGGTAAHETVALVALDHVVAYRYPRPRWLPWVIAGGGVAIGLGGLALRESGDTSLTRFDAEWSAQCPAGCTLAAQPGLADRRSSALRDRKAGVALIGAGGAVAVAGIVLVILNRPVRVVPTLEVAPGGTGARVGLTWQR